METRTRKLAPQYHRQEWRNKPCGNSATHKHSREFILKNYQNLIEPQFHSHEEIDNIILTLPSPPLLTAFFPFAHNLGEEVNSRKHVQREKRAEQIPEWYEEEEPKENSENSEALLGSGETEKEKVAGDKEIRPFANVKNTEKGINVEEKDIEEKFTKIDLEVEERLKKLVNEEEDDVPDWDEPSKEEFRFEPIKVIRPAGPAFDVNLLKYHSAIGNAFVGNLIDSGVPIGKDMVTYTPGSKPFEKIWYYKDLENNVHGPFSTLEMFAWTIRECFPPDLLISNTKNNFIPMNSFTTNTQTEKSEPPPKNNKEPKTLEEIEILQSSLAGKSSNPNNSEYRKNTKTNETATLELKNFLGLLTKK